MQAKLIKHSISQVSAGGHAVIQNKDIMYTARQLVLDEVAKTQGSYSYSNLELYAVIMCVSLPQTKRLVWFTVRECY